MAAVNARDNEQKLQWLGVQLTDGAHLVYQGLPTAVKETYEYNPRKRWPDVLSQAANKSSMFAEWHSLRKSQTEGWAKFDEDLKCLTHKASQILKKQSKGT